jgi:hypothetical protein
MFPKDLIEILNKKETLSTLYISYSITLRSLHKRVFLPQDFNVDNFSDVSRVMEDLEKKPPQVINTTLAILR